MSLMFVPLVTTTSMLMMGAVMASFEMTSKRCMCLTNCIFLPLFMSTSVTSHCCAGADLIGAASNADWCSGGSASANDNDNAMSQIINSPDGTMSDAMKVRGMNETSSGCQVVDWHVKQCDCGANDPWLFMRDKTTCDSSMSLQTTTTDMLTSTCSDGTQDFNKFYVLSNAMRNNMHTSFESARAALRLLRCDCISPVHASLAHDGTCTHSMTKFSWMWSSLSVIAFCSVIMIMFRSSVQETVATKDLFSASHGFDDDNNNEESDPSMGDDNKDERNNNDKNGRGERGRSSGRNNHHPNFVDDDHDDVGFWLVTHHANDMSLCLPQQHCCRCHQKPQCHFVDVRC